MAQGRLELLREECECESIDAGERYERNRGSLGLDDEREVAVGERY